MTVARMQGLRRLGKPLEADAVCEAAIGQFGPLTELRTQQMVNRYQAKNLQGVAESYRSLTAELPPEELDPMAFGLAALCLGRGKDAEQFMARAAISPETGPPASALLAQYQAASGRLPDALASIDQSLEQGLSPIDNGSVALAARHLLRAELLNALGRHTEAVAAARTAHAFAPDDVKAPLVWASATLRNNDVPTLHEAADAALKADLENTRALTYKLHAVLNTRDPARPDEPDAIAGTSEELLALADRLRESADALPPQVAAKLTKCYFALGRLTDARQVAETALAASPPAPFVQGFQEYLRLIEEQSGSRVRTAGAQEALPR